MAPEMETLELKYHTPLLAGSFDEGDEHDDEQKEWDGTTPLG